MNLGALFVLCDFYDINGCLYFAKNNELPQIFLHSNQARHTNDTINLHISFLGDPDITLNLLKRRL
jgi:hypothetical protein